MRATQKLAQKSSRRRSGQVVVEYLLVTAMVVGVVAAVYLAVGQRMRKPLADIKEKIEGNPGDPSGRSAGSGAKGYAEYYRNVEIQTK